MANEITIPILPCAAIDETLQFYVALGFEITYQQQRPNIYGCVKREAIELHFFTLKGFDPANSYSTCVVLVEDVDDLHAAFITNLRQHYRKIPVVGIPRITKPNNKNAAGDRRFNVIDPGGNWIRFVQWTGKAEEAAAPEKATSQLARAILAAELLVNSKGDFPAAAKMLDAALERNEPGITNIQRIQAWVLRAEVALNMDDAALAGKLISDIHQIDLTAVERSALADALENLEALEQQLA